MLGATRFNIIQRETGVPRDRLADRLRKLEQAGVIARNIYCERPRRYEYRLTCSGRALAPVLDALRVWDSISCRPLAGRMAAGVRPANAGHWRPAADLQHGMGSITARVRW
jgi:DNA-binding HxlR family transcriptional regulator